jgi:signal transduction histidine kinase
MDAPAGKRDDRQMRRVGTWLVPATVATVYVAVAAWRLSIGQEFTTVIWIVFIGLPFLVCGGILVVFRPRHPIGVLLLASGFALLLVPFTLQLVTEVAGQQSGRPGWTWAAVWASTTSSGVALVLLSSLLVLLPDGRPRYPRERWFLGAAWIVVALPTLTMLSNRHMVSTDLAFPTIDRIISPLFIEGLEPLGPVFVALDGQSYLIAGAAIALLFLRYRAAPTRQRKQIRWVLFAGVVSSMLVLVVPQMLGQLGVFPPVGDFQTPLRALLLIPMILLPVSVVVAVMDPPWLDVDIAIRKSFVLGALSVAILLLYVVVAAALGIAVGTGLGLSVELATVLTVVIAILFQPARDRLQAIADRWVFGARPTKYQAVTEFGVTIERAADPTDLLPRLVETIKRAIRLEWATAALDDGTRAAAGDVTGEPAMVVPIETRDEQIGQIACGPKAEGSIDGDEIQLVKALAGQLGLAVMNARLAGRIVNAAEAERRRIERNIHDGAQQELVALVARLGMARLVAAQGGLTPDDIDDLRLEAQQILSDLRELAQGIHPSVLSDGGIVEAVEERCARLPLEVSLEASAGIRTRRFEDEVEGAAYFFVTESLANVLKHANATRIEVSLDYDGGRILLDVADDGRGFDPDTASANGLAGLRDRIRALGGTVSVASGLGSGTRISASLPEARP